ncbi:hypothetical protein [Variovorax rhizosphaerae]|uniref:Uncharacterized protein n=1 Tax=Variovorax rhizosphaerae TaxID=1836200 RepID=A0ABU8WC36_9BURK
MKTTTLPALLVLSSLAACGGGSSGGGTSILPSTLGAIEKPTVAAAEESTTSSVVAQDAKSSSTREKTITAPLAREGELFSKTVTARVRFGSGSNWRELTIPAHTPVTCGAAAFGEPGAAAPRICETIEEVPTVETGKIITPLANEGQLFKLSVDTPVRFGSGNNWREILMPANVSINCHVNIFGDPGVPAPRVCVTAVDGVAPAPAAPAPAPAPATSPKVITSPLAKEGQMFHKEEPTRVRFGSGNNWREVTLAANQVVTCGTGVFGDPGVPAPRVCETIVNVPAVETGKIITPLVNEGQLFQLPKATLVRFGSGNNWREIEMPANLSINCHVNIFGNPGVAAPRTCVTVVDGVAPAPAPAPVAPAPAAPAPSPAPAPAAPAPAPSGSGQAVSGDVVDASGKVVSSAYKAVAAAMSGPTGITYRYGSNAASYGASGGSQLYGPRPNNLTPNYPYMAAAYQNVWQVGTRGSNPGLYSSNQANVTFVADNPANVGITDFQTTNHILGTFAQLPQLSWTLYGGGLDSINVKAYKAEGIVNGEPIAVARCGGRAGGCISGVAAFQNGVIASVGNNTALNRASVKLPANKVPTGIAMTNGSEFALVTVWDTDALKGQVAVVSLAGLCDNCNPYNRNANGNYKAWYEWWGGWMGVYPGLPSMGNIAFMKILGYVDLVAPDGSAMNAPTEIAVTTGLDPFNSMVGGVGFMGYTYPLTNQGNRQAFLDGGLNYKYAKGGMAVVISKSEKKAAFIDLKPLFSYANSVYFGGDIGTFNARMASLGQADNQWPYTFANQPQQKPTTVSMLALADKPTAVRTTVWGPNQRAWIATHDGMLRVYSLGNYASGENVSTGTPASIAEIKSYAINVGRNPTSLAWSKGEPDIPTTYADPNMQVLVNSRGDRKISWVRFSGNGTSSIPRTFQDPRMADPIAIEEADNFANWAHVVTVADYDGRAVHNFRYGPVTFIDGSACNGGCQVVATNGTRVEYGGKMDLPGRPFQVSGANVP